MSTASPSFGTKTAITLTLASLSSDTNLLVGRESDALNLESLDAIDVVLSGKITTGTSPTASRQIEVWAWATAGNAGFLGGAAGSGDAGLTVTAESKVQMRLIEALPTHATSNTAYYWTASVMSLFGFLPSKAGLFVVHNTGVNLNSTGGNHEAYYQTIKYESA